MRPSQKSGRSRGKNNRNRSVGHSPNRVYESAGPEGKVRGTPQQVIDKYLSLARDAQLSGDRVTAENFLQHAEHYARILIATQEAMSQSREQNGGQNNGSQQPASGGHDDTGERNESGAQQGAGDSDADQPARAQSNRRGRDGGRRKAEEAATPDAASGDQPPSDGLAAIDAAEDGPDIVETPESKAKPAERRPRRPRAKAAKVEPPAEGDASGESPAEVAE